MPTVDVAVPCYNYAHFLRDAVESILAQSHRDLRVLIIDNGSTDASGAVARQLAAEDERVSVRALPRNIGPHGCYNAAVDWASAPYFFLLDADDLLIPGSLERGVAVMEQNAGLAFCFSTELFMGLNGDPYTRPAFTPRDPAWRITNGADFIRERCRDPRNVVGAPTVLRRTAVQKRIGHYRPALPFTDDFEMWLRLATAGNVAQADTPQGIRRVHGAQASEAYREVPARDFLAIVAAFESFFAHEGASLPDARALLSQVRKSIGEELFWYGRGRHREGDRGNAALCIKYGLQLHPFANAPRLLKWLLSGEVPLSEAAQYVSALIAPAPGLGRRSAQATKTPAAARAASNHPAE